MKNATINIFLLIIMLTISSCIGRRTKLTDDDLVINSRLYSPDRKYVVYEISYDIGALGYSDGWCAIVKTSDTTGVINKNEFHCMGNPPYACYTPDRWLDDHTLQVKIDEEGFIRSGLPFDTSSFNVGEVKIKVVLSDPTYGSPAIIEHYAVSPDGNKLLVAYKYSGASDLNIAVIKLTDTLPFLGNIYTSTDDNFILFGKWEPNDEITIIVYEGLEKIFQSQLNKQNKYKVNIMGGNYVSKCSGIKAGWYNKELHPNDNKSKEELQNNQVTAYAIITEIYDWGDSPCTQLSNFNYQYKVQGKVYKSYFRSRLEDCKLKEGDSIKIVYDKRQPVIHEPAEYNNR